MAKKDLNYLWSMSYAPTIDESVHWFQLLLISFFTAVIIVITRMATYTRDMSQFYWTNSGDSLTDFFSYYKMIAVVICGVLAIVFLAYRAFTQSLAIKRTIVYIPMAVYSLFVLLSYATSEYKEFAWLGWNDRFEGTAVLLAYMVMLFYVINSINTEKAVKWVVYPVGVTSALLGLLGITQALDKDFFRTTIGQKLIVPNSMNADGTKMWDLINQAAEKGDQLLSFTFQNKEIYQTVYNINYVSFYLTLLIPLFGLLFIHSVTKGKEEPIWKKLLWGALFALLLFNLIGAASSGGYLGMAVVVLLAIIIINKKILQWWKPLAVMIAITIIVGGVTVDRWMPEITNTFRVMNTKPETIAEEPGTPVGQMEKGHLDFFKTEGNDIIVGYNSHTVIFTTYPEDPTALKVKDSSDNDLSMVPTNISPIYKVTDDRFKNITIRSTSDEAGNNYIVVGTDGHEWPFLLNESGVRYLNGLGKLVQLESIDAIGWKNNQDFGSGRGYIWSRTIPMMKETVLLGYGADTYCIYYPHKDYVGKYNTGTFGNGKDIIVDKPHNMYMGMWVGTGGLSVISFLALMVIYLIQSICVYWRNKFDSFMDFAGIGIFLGIMGFAVTGFVDDSTVSVMPMFYGLLGTGIAINMILKRMTLSK